MIYLLYIFILFILIFLLLYFYLKRNNSQSSIKHLYSEALDMLLSGRKKSAYKIFKEVVALDSDNIKAYIYIGQILRETNNINKALSIHKNLLLRENKTTYETVQIYKNLSLDYYDLNNIEKSISFCKKILALNKLDDWAIRYLIRLYKKSNDWDNAIKYLKDYFSIIGKYDNNKLALYKIQRARYSILDEDFESSRMLLEKALDLDNDLFIIYYFLGNTFAAESNFIFNKSINQENNHNSLSIENEKNTNYLEAEKVLTKAIPMWIHFIENMPQYSWMILPTLQDALQALNRYEDIEKYLIQINMKKTNDVDILSHLADFYANKGQVEQALDTINQALDYNDKSLLAQLKKLKIISLKKNEKELSSNIDRLISSLLKDSRYKKYKQSYDDKNMIWLFETNMVYNDES